MPYFEIYKDTAGYYRWRFKAGNGQIIADSGEGYVRQTDCEAGINLVKQYASVAQVTVLTY